MLLDVLLHFLFFFGGIIIITICENKIQLSHVKHLLGSVILLGHICPLLEIMEEMSVRLLLHLLEELKLQY
jgi:hypothetical protein